MLTDALPEECWWLILGKIEWKIHNRVCMTNRHCRANVRAWITELSPSFTARFTTADVFSHLSRVDLAAICIFDLCDSPDPINELLDNKSNLCTVKSLALPLISTDRADKLLRRMPRLEKLSIMYFFQKPMKGWGFLGICAATMRVLCISISVALKTKHVEKLAGYLPNLESLDINCEIWKDMPSFCGWNKLQHLHFPYASYPSCVTLADIDRKLPESQGLDSMFICSDQDSVAMQYFTKRKSVASPYATYFPGDWDVLARRIKKPTKFIYEFSCHAANEPLLFCRDFYEFTALLARHHRLSYHTVMESIVDIPDLKGYLVNYLLCK